MSSDGQNHHLAPAEILRGENVYIRLPRMEELSFIRSLWGDPDTMAAVGGPVELPQKKASEWFARVVGSGDPSHCYCLIFNQDDAPVGEISFHRWDACRRSANLNIKVFSGCRGHGYAKDALRTFLEFFFGRVGGRLMTDDVASGNRPGQRLLESIGFETDGSVPDMCRMMMNRQMYLEKYGEPNRVDPCDG